MSRAAVTREAVDAMNTVHLAREIARKLRDEKSSHPWTDEECRLLAALCATLGVDDERKSVNG